MLSSLFKKIFHLGSVFRSSKSVVSVKQHGIQPEKISALALFIVDVLSTQGFKAYVVGGAVRDLLLGRTPKDFDVGTNAQPEQIVRLFKRARIIGRRFRIVHVMKGREIVEVSTFRCAAEGERVDEHGRLLRDNCYGTHQQDALRRDFTINALYYDPKSRDVLDFHNGWHDLRHKIVRMIGSPAVRYREDPVRMLRAIRFSVKLGFTIDKKTLAAISSLAHLIVNVPPARLFDEMVKLIFCGHAWECFLRLQAAGIKGGIFPFLEYIHEEQDEAFMQLVLKNTDARVLANKYVSLSFVFAALMWSKLRRYCKHFESQGHKKRFSFFSAIDQLMTEDVKSMAIPRRLLADIRELWVLQWSFLKRQGLHPARLVENQRFRAAYDFLLLRKIVGEVDSEFVTWWQTFLQSTPLEREEMVKEHEKNRPTPRIRRHVKKSPPSAGVA